MKSSIRSWTLKPGERLSSNDALEVLIDNYLVGKRDKHLMVSNEPDGSVVYFIEIDRDKVMTHADVAIFCDGTYQFLPVDIARSIADAYVLHAKLVANAFDHLQASE